MPCLNTVLGGQTIQQYFELYYGAIRYRIHLGEHCENPEELLGTLDPDLLYACLQDGARTMLAASANQLGVDTRTALDNALNRAARSLGG